MTDLISAPFAAVVMTDVVQLVVMYVGGLSLLALSLWEVGGWGSLREGVAALGDQFADHFTILLPNDHSAFPWSGIVFGLLYQGAGLPFFMALVLTILCGAALGGINGYLTAYLGFMDELYRSTAGEVSDLLGRKLTQLDSEFNTKSLEKHRIRSEAQELAIRNGGNTRKDAKFDIDGAIGLRVGAFHHRDGVVRKGALRDFADLVVGKDRVSDGDVDGLR